MTDNLRFRDCPDSGQFFRTIIVRLKRSKKIAAGAANGACAISLGLLLELAAVVVGGQPRVLEEQACEEAGIVVADLVADGLDALAGGGQQALGGFDAQALQVVWGRY